MIILTTLVVFPYPIVRIHAASTPGTVCLADPSTPPSPNPCSLGTSTIFDAPLTIPNHQIRIGVYINGSAGFNAFEIVLKANSTVLKPAGADLTGSILSQPILVAECLGTMNLTSTKCDSPTPDTLEMFAGKTGLPISTPSTGLLFTAIYNITATTSSTISIGFQSGCTISSVSGTSLCVAFVNGISLTPLPETALTASFNNSNQIPYLTITAAPNSIGPMIVGSTQTLRLNLTGQNGWNQLFCPCSATLSTVTDKSVRVSMNTTTPSIASSGFAFVSMNVSGTVGGTYSLTVFAQYSSMDLVNFQSDTLVAHATFQVVITDFAMSASPMTSIPVLIGTAASSTVTVSSVNGFSGTVGLTISTGSGQCGLSPTSIAVTVSGTSTLSCLFSSIGNYTVTLTGTNGPASHTILLSFSEQDFAVSVSSPNLAFVAGSSANLNLTVTGLNGFGQVVSLTVSAPSGVTVTSISGTFFPPSTQHLKFASSAPGVYNVTLTLSYSGVSRSSTVQVRVSAAKGPSGSPTLFGVPLAVVYAIIAALGIIVATVVLLVVRGQRSKVSVPLSFTKDSSGKKNS
jgi:hypothetical protein